MCLQNISQHIWHNPEEMEQYDHRTYYNICLKWPWFGLFDMCVQDQYAVQVCMHNIAVAMVRRICDCDLGYFIDFVNKFT